MDNIPKSFVTAKYALKNKPVNSKIKNVDDKKKYYPQPGLLYNEYVSRRMLDFNNEEGEFIGKIVAGGYDKVAKSWRVEY